MVRGDFQPNGSLRHSSCKVTVNPFLYLSTPMAQSLRDITSA